MSSAEGSPNRRYEAQEEQAFTTQKSSPDLLRHVLEETLARGEAGLSQDEWRSLQVIARRMESAATVEVVTQSLVESLLSTRFPGLADVNSRRQMCQLISRSLCEDPVSLERIHNFWQQLRESVS